MRENHNLFTIIVLLVGFGVFGVLMAIRYTMPPSAGRHALAAIAFAWGAAVVVYALRKRTA